MTTTTNTPVKFKSVLGTVELHLYVDPHPDKVGSDRVPTECNRCGGSGWFNAFRHIEGGRCFECHGTGQGTMSVTAARKWAKADAFAEEYGDQLAAYWADFEAEQAKAAAAKELSEAWDDAHREAARRAKMNQGTLGQVGERLKGIEATVTVSAGYERTSFRGYGTDYVKLVILTAASGEVLKVSGTASDLYGLERGDKVTVTGTVKEHASYKGQMQTVLQRPKIQVHDDEADEAPAAPAPATKAPASSTDVADLLGHFGV